MRRIVTLIGLLFAALVLTACGDDTDSASSGDTDTSPSSEASGDFNDADVAFAQGMIPHHEQAVEMAQLAADRAESAEVKELAADIEAAQAPEIDKLTTWLDAWGAEPADDSMEGMDHGDMGDDSSGMSGMMSEEDMTMLEDASGTEFDQMFLEMMIEHHEGAVDMAETEVAEGQNPDAIAMAKEIISTQEAEIDQMKQLLGS